jgi:hypothetical protein
VRRRLLRQSRQLPQKRMRRWRLLRREQEDLPDRVPCLSRHLPTAFVAAVAAVATITAATTTRAAATITASVAAAVATITAAATTRALLSWRRLRVLGRQPVRQGPVAHTCDWEW